MIAKSCHNSLVAWSVAAVGQCARRPFVISTRSSLRLQRFFDLTSFAPTVQPIRATVRMASSGSGCVAIVAESFGEPEVMQLAEKALPAVAEKQVLVEIKAVGINPSDTYMRLGPHGPWAATPHLLPKPPFTPGKDGAGVIIEVGPGVEDVSVGQRVYTTGSITGTYASHAICDASTVHALPDEVSFAQGACVGVPCATAYHALMNRAKVVAGQNVFIHGASGAVGLAAVQLAKDLGCFVVGTAGSTQGLEAVKEYGADVALNHRDSGYLEKAKEAASEGFDVILEMAAHANLSADFKLAGKRSCICIVGSKAQEVGFNPRLPMVPEVDIKGVFLGTATPSERTQMRKALYEAMQKGSLKPVVGMELPLADAPKAHIEVMGPSSGGALGNIVLIPNEQDQERVKRARSQL